MSKEAGSPKRIREIGLSRMPNSTRGNLDLQNNLIDSLNH